LTGKATSENIGAEIQSLSKAFHFEVCFIRALDSAVWSLVFCWVSSPKAGKDLTYNLELCTDYFIDSIHSLEQASRNSNTVCFRVRVPKLVFRGAEDAQFALKGWRL